MNIPKQNLHTHTIYCDGANTPEEFVKAAIESGFEGIGFSSHSYQYFSPKHTMLEEPALQYKKNTVENFRFFPVWNAICTPPVLQKATIF